jgi:hypothetical protein
LHENIKSIQILSGKKSDVSPLGKLNYSCMGILFGIGVFLITWWTINEFLPIFISFSFLLAIVNGFIYAIPLILQYQIFKL